MDKKNLTLGDLEQLNNKVLNYVADYPLDGSRRNELLFSFLGEYVKKYAEIRSWFAKEVSVPLDKLNMIRGETPLDSHSMKLYEELVLWLEKEEILDVEDR